MLNCELLLLPWPSCSARSAWFLWCNLLYPSTSSKPGLKDVLGCSHGNGPRTGSHLTHSPPERWIKFWEANTFRLLLGNQVSLLFCGSAITCSEAGCRIWLFQDHKCEWNPSLRAPRLPRLGLTFWLDLSIHWYLFHIKSHKGKTDMLFKQVISSFNPRTKNGEGFPFLLCALLFVLQSSSTVSVQWDGFLWFQCRFVLTITTLPGEKILSSILHVY